MSSPTPTSKGSKRLERLSRYLKQKIPSRRTVTTLTGLGRSKKTKSTPSPAPTNIQADCPKRAAEPLNLELHNEPLNRVLLLDHNCWLAKWPKNKYNLDKWLHKQRKNK